MDGLISRAVIGAALSFNENEVLRDIPYRKVKDAFVGADQKHISVFPFFQVESSMIGDFL